MGFFSKSHHYFQSTNGVTLIADGTTLKGDMNTKTDIQIDGVYEGNIHSDKAIHISTSGKVQGLLNGDHVIIYGEFKGEINANRVEIGNQANVQAEILTVTIAIQEGAKFEGTQKLKPAATVHSGKGAPAAKALDNANKVADTTPKAIDTMPKPLEVENKNTSESKDKLKV